MAKLKVPSLQHLARNWRDDPAQIQRILVRLAQNPPIFNYNALFSAVRDLFALRTPYDQVVRGIRENVKRSGVRDNLLSILPLINEHFEGISPDFVQSVERRYYPVGRELMVPFEPPLMYGVDGQFYFPWFSFWRQNPLTAERLSLFVTLVEEVLLEDPDLENAHFEILDFSAPNPKERRELIVINANDVPRVDAARKLKMLETFAEGYLRALAELSRESAADAGEDQTADDADPQQPGLFD